MKKYTFLLVTLVLLASCGTETTVTPEEVTNELPQVETPSVVEEIENETTTTTEETDAEKIIELNQSYTSPGWEEKVAFTITLDGEKIRSVAVVGTSDNEISGKRMQAFADAINGEISGKTLEEAKEISVVGGSSLTTGAFKAALKSM